MSSTNTYQAVVDDSDNQIHYTGPGWFPHKGTDLDGLKNGPPYLHTLHGTTMDSSLSFSFEGTLITLVGTINQTNASGAYDPTWECLVDNINIGGTAPVIATENNWNFCGKDGLSDGPHEVVLRIKSAGQTFWFDRALYRPSPNLSFDNGGIFYVDSSDPSVVYDSKWQTVPTPGREANMTETYGSTVTFNFTGTKVEWIGTIPANTPHNPSSATYSIDEGPPVFFNLTGGAYPETNQFSQTFFTTPDLPARLHTLKVTYLGNGQQTPLTLDYMFLTVTSYSPNANPSAKGSRVGDVVGGIVGGIAALVILISVLLWRYRVKRKRVQPPDDNTSVQHYEFGVTPYTYSMNSTMVSGSGPSGSSRPVFNSKSGGSRGVSHGHDAPPEYTES